MPFGGFKRSGYGHRARGGGRTSGAILHPADLPVRDRGGGIRMVPLVTSGLGARLMLNGITTLAPGSAVPLHAHNREESVAVLSGRAQAHIEEIERDLTSHDTTWISAEVPHFFRNLADSGPMSILWTYALIDATTHDHRDGARRGSSRSIGGHDSGIRAD